MKQQSKETVLVLANATTLVTGVVGKLAGGQIAGTIGGAKATNEALTDLVGSHIQTTLTTRSSLRKPL
jgi:hypothetical protein